MIWQLVQWGAAAFGTLFGGLFVFAGATRVLRARSEPSPTDARIWGGFGVLLGLGLLAGVCWLALVHILP